MEVRDFVRVSALRGLAVPIAMLGSLLLLPVVGATGVELSWALIFVVQAIIVARFQPSETAAPPT